MNGTTAELKRWFAANSCSHVNIVAEHADSITRDEEAEQYVFTFGRFEGIKPAFELTPDVTNAFNKCAHGKARIELMIVRSEHMLHINEQTPDRRRANTNRQARTRAKRTKALPLVQGEGDSER